MLRHLTTKFILALLLAACSTTQGSVSRKSIQIDAMTVTWNDMLQLNSLHEAFPTEKGTSIYMFTRLFNDPTYTPRKAQLSNGWTVTGNIGACDLILRKQPANAQQLYDECRTKLAALPAPKPQPELGLKEFINLAERAVQQEGSCQWLGYDRGLDLTVRAHGSLASFSDERLFFAKLKCS